jgi:RNA polymerase sigma-70 factor (ECF subfamily)
MTDPRLAPKPSDREADVRLVRSVVAGDRLALQRFAERLKVVPRALAVINGRRAVRLSAHDLEDLRQDTLVRIWSKLETFDGQATLENWLYRFAFLELLNRVRSESRAPRRERADLDELTAVEAAEGPDEVEIERALERLGPPEADVVRLKHYEELTFEAIGRRLGISPNTAKTRYYRGITWLQRELGGALRAGVAETVERTQEPI